DAGKTQYTQASGIIELRERISQWYSTRFGVNVPANRIVLTAGASAALQLACLALIETGDEILMPDPSYPCNRQFVSAAEGTPVLIPCTAAERYQLSCSKVEAAWKNGITRGVLLASPSNPTGTSIHPDEMRRIHTLVSRRGGITLVDEIYLGLSFDETYGKTALELDDQIISINSFSKYFNMTGWRLGWLVVPEKLAPVIERIAQNLFICPSSISQQAALACFEDASIKEYEQRRAEFKARRDYFIPALQSLGFEIPVMPDGAFYAWADCSQICRKLGVASSWELAFEIMQKAHIAVTPGRDFGSFETAKFIRFSTASSMPTLVEAIARLKAMLS
ncbi:MAG TPA: pyridoxal phosphate-dependent aminotransferase, partial [Burkholderiaceae bacterium]|nr:pyridoxal phosphate-dependent aminotransferase [Burkholderiaceae bacterium]